MNGNTGILDAVFGSVTTKSLSVSNVTLTLLESQVSIIRLTGSLGTSVQITFGSVIKAWIIDNQTAGNQSSYIRLVGSPGTGNAVCAPPGTSQIFWDGTNMSFLNLPVPIGGYWDHCGTAVPPWVLNCTIPPFLLCDGSGYNTSTYPQLFGFLQSSSVPDARARMRIPLDGGTGRVTTAGSGVDGSTRGASGGAQNVTLDATQMPAHDHTGSTGNNSVDHTHSVNDAPSKVGQFSAGGSNGWAANTVVQTGGQSTPHTHAISVAGGGLAHSNMPPVFVGGITMIRAA